MKSYFLNGGMIGPTLDYGDTAQHIIGTTQQRATLVYVGGQTVSFNGTTSTANITFNLTGGIATTPEANDLVIVAYAVGTGTSRNPTLDITTGYTAVFNQIFQVDATTTSTKFGVWYKRMGTTPDTQFTRSGTGNTLDGGVISIHVWRNVDATTPFDVTTTTSQSANTAIPNPPAITPVTTNAVILVAAGAGSATGNQRTFTATYLSNFITAGADDDFDATIGMGSIAWTSGAYDPAAWTFSTTDSTNYSYVAATMALRPALINVPIYGNRKNSGIWNLAAQYDDRFYNFTPPGQVEFTFMPGTYQWTVLPGMTEISAVCIGGGGGGAGGESGRNEGVNGGAGGGLAYGTFPVTPGEILTLVVGTGGAGGTTGNDGNNGNPTSISRGATVLLQGGGGQGGLERSTGTRTGGTSTGTERDGGGNGGNSGGNSTDTGSGGGGAGGYSGNGGAGGTTGAGSAGAGGGGGGGGATNSGTGYGGGGTGWLGQGTNGAGGALNNPGGGGSDSSGNANSFGPDGGYPGGGGGGCDDDTNGSGGNGADGALRIIWGIGRSYPSTNTGDV